MPYGAHSQANLSAILSLRLVSAEFPTGKVQGSMWYP
eukprot:CAMPEP_0197501302 /NCGR_PEP_ID=MMETSP1312-20131121/567_1 /TAXON_ID=464262 /ORGANISM="Genus nov. species nov., Strain RCC2335" /LENGTH=36 /DNA_ID= /DNA_START= /DNA_END= /DNA_ORIENTATION=